MQDDIIINKSEIMSRCLKRVREEYAKAGTEFLTDYSRQDASILNIERSIQAAIDMAAHLVRKKSLRVPKESRELFDALQEAKLISMDLSKKMKRMVGFRNLVVHEYQKIDMQIVASVIEKCLPDLEDFVKAILR